MATTKKRPNTRRPKSDAVPNLQSATVLRVKDNVLSEIQAGLSDKTREGIDRLSVLTCVLDALSRAAS